MRKLTKTKHRKPSQPREKNGRFISYAEHQLRTMMRREHQRQEKQKLPGFTTPKHLPSKGGSATVVDTRWRTSFGGTVPVNPSKRLQAKTKRQAFKTPNGRIPEYTAKETYTISGKTTHVYYWRWYGDAGQQAMQNTVIALKHDPKMRARWSVGSGYGKGREWIGDTDYMRPAFIASRVQLWKGRISAKHIKERSERTGEVWFELEVITTESLEGKVYHEEGKASKKAYRAGSRRSQPSRRRKTHATRKVRSATKPNRSKSHKSPNKSNRHKSRNSKRS